MKEAFGLRVPQNLQDIVQPSRCALIVYDMQAGIVPQISYGLEVQLGASLWLSLHASQIVTDACGSKTEELKQRSLASMHETGEVFMTSTTEVAELLKSFSRVN